MKFQLDALETDAARSRLYGLVPTEKMPIARSSGYIRVRALRQQIHPLRMRVLQATKQPRTSRPHGSSAACTMQRLFRQFFRLYGTATNKCMEIVSSGNESTGFRGGRRLGGGHALLGLLPVDHLPDGLEVVGLDVLVLQVVRVLPCVDTDQRDVRFRFDRPCG